MYFVCVHYKAMSKGGQIHIFENVHLYFTFICLYITGIINEMKQTTRMANMLLDGSVMAVREWSGFGLWKCEVIELV